MTIYTVRYAKAAKKEFLKLPKHIQIHIAEAVDLLKNDPREGNVRPLIGIPSWRLRVGDYRIIYAIKDRVLTVLIIRIRHRKDAYKNI